MSAETRRVLDLLSQGKISVDEADQLLHAIGTPGLETPAGAGGEEAVAPPRFFRIVVHKAATDGRLEKKVNIRIPMSIARSGMRLAALIPGFSKERATAHLRERGIDVDLAKLDYKQIEELLKDLGELTIDVNDGKEVVRMGYE
jgi:hypothetical protein